MRQRIILVLFLATLVAPVLFLQSGCGDGGSDWVDPDPVGSFNKGMKNQVFNTLNDAKPSAERAETGAAFLLEIFEEKDLSKAGEHEETYEKLRADAQELLSMCQQSASRSDVNAKIDEMIALTETLPGEIEPRED